jgi:hypothetical protein
LRAGTTSGITVNTAGQVTARTALVSGDLPAATTTAAGALKSPWLFTATADKTVANTTTETSLVGTGVGTLTLPANCLTAGRSVRVTARGYVTNRNAAEIDFKLKLGGATIATIGAHPPSSTNPDQGWEANLVLTCRTTGVSGTAIGQGSFAFYDSGTLLLTWQASGETSTVTVDTTGTLATDLTATWDTIDPQNTITCTNCTIELIG